MSPIDRELMRSIRKIRDRMHTAVIFRLMLLGAAAALGAGLALMLASRFFPIYGVWRMTLILLGTAVAAMFLGAAFFPPGNGAAALKADRMGLEERAITALEQVGRQSAFGELVKSDALARLKSLDYRKAIPVMPGKKYWLVCLALAALLAVTGFIPNPMNEEAEARHRIKEQIAGQQKKADQLAERVKNNPKLTGEQKKEIEQKLAELKKELQAAESGRDIEKALDRAEKKLQYIARNDAGDDLQKIADALAKNEMTRELGRLIERGDEEALKEHFRQLSEDLKNLSPQEKQQLSQELSKLAQALKSDPALRQAFSDLAQQLARGQLGDISRELSQVADGIQSLMQDEAVRDAIEAIARELEAGRSAGTGQQDGFQGQGNQPGAGNRPGQGEAPGQQGQGAGQGGGAGDGTGAGTENPRPVEPGGQGIGKKDGSEKKTGEYEKIFTPETLGGDGETSRLPGAKGSGGSGERLQTDSGPAIRGSAVPYDQVIGNYRQKAMESMEASDIPPGMQDLVKDYFTSLEE